MDPAKQVDSRFDISDLAVAMSDFFSKNFPQVSVRLYTPNGSAKQKIEIRNGRLYARLRMSGNNKVWAQIGRGYNGFYLGSFPDEVRDNLARFLSRLGLEGSFRLPRQLEYEYPRLSRSETGSIVVDRGPGFSPLALEMDPKTGVFYAVGKGIRQYLSNSPLYEHLEQACACFRRRPQLRDGLYESGRERV